MPKKAVRGDELDLCDEQTAEWRSACHEGSASLFLLLSFSFMILSSHSRRQHDEHLHDIQLFKISLRSMQR